MENFHTVMKKPGGAGGTPAYMSPEQASGDVDQIDERSDIFTLGVILFEILSGVIPSEQTFTSQIIPMIWVVRVLTEQTQIHTLTQSLPKSLVKYAFSASKKSHRNDFKIRLPLPRRFKSSWMEWPKRRGHPNFHKRSVPTRRDLDAQGSQGRSLKRFSRGWPLGARRKNGRLGKKRKSHLLYRQASLKRVRAKHSFMPRSNSIPSCHRRMKRLLKSIFESIEGQKKTEMKQRLRNMRHD